MQVFGVTDVISEVVDAENYAILTTVKRSLQQTVSVIMRNSLLITKRSAMYTLLLLDITLINYLKP